MTKKIQCIVIHICFEHNTFGKIDFVVLERAHFFRIAIRAGKVMCELVI